MDGWIWDSRRILTKTLENSRAIGRERTKRPFGSPPEAQEMGRFPDRKPAHSKDLRRQFHVRSRLPRRTEPSIGVSNRNDGSDGRVHGYRHSFRSCWIRSRRRYRSPGSIEP